MSRAATPQCPLRPGDPCSLCVPGAHGPHDCQTVRLVMEDPDLRELLREKQAQWKARRQAEQEALGRTAS